MQYSVSKPVIFSGYGLNEGKHNIAVVSPATENTGIIFYNDNLEVLADYSKVIHKPLCTSLGDNQKNYIRTVEHLLAAFYCAEIDNAYVYVNNKELPLLDGSCFEYFQKLYQVRKNISQIKTKTLIIKKTVEYKIGQRFIKIQPNDHLSVHIRIKPKCGFQEYKSQITPKHLQQYCLDARTFGPLFKGVIGKILTKYTKTPCAQGANWNNTILLTKNKSIIKGGLRYENEHVRHRVMDLIGDMMLCGTRHIRAHIETNSTSHQMNAELLKKIFSSDENYIWING